MELSFREAVEKVQEESTKTLLADLQYRLLKSEAENHALRKYIEQLEEGGEESGEQKPTTKRV